MSGRKFSLVLMMFLVLASRFFVFATSAEVSEDLAASALSGAEEAVVSTFQVVLETERSGANVSGLLGRLSEAGGLLAQARMAFRVGDFDEAVRFAGLSEDIGLEVKNVALGLKDLASSESVRFMWFTVMGSILGVVLLVLGSFWVWRVFKGRYYERLLGMKPEVSSDES